MARLRERKQVAYGDTRIDETEETFEPRSTRQKKVSAEGNGLQKGRGVMAPEASRELSDEIEDSEDQSDEIAEDSASDEQEVMDRPKQKKRMRKLASLNHGGAQKKKTVAKAADQNGAILRYTQPNVSNVKETGRQRAMVEQGKVEREGRAEANRSSRPRRAAAAAVNYNEDFILDQGLILAEAQTTGGRDSKTRKASGGGRKSSEGEKMHLEIPGPGSEDDKRKEAVVPDSDDEAQNEKPEVVVLDEEQGQEARRSSRQRARLNYAETAEGGRLADDLVKSSASQTRKEALQALSKRKVEEAEEEPKQKSMEDLNGFMYQRRKKGEKDSKEGEEARQEEKSRKRPLRDARVQNRDRSRSGLQLRRKEETTTESSGSEDERPRKKKALRRTSPVRKSERARKVTKESLAEVEESDEEESNADEESEEEAASSGDEEEEGSAGDNDLEGRVEKILAPAKGCTHVEDRSFMVKFHEKSYRAARAVSESVLMEHCPQLMRNYLAKGGEGTEDQPFNPEYVIIERIIAGDQESGSLEYLVKWRGLDYGKSTWEKVEDLHNDLEAIAKYEEAVRKKPVRDRKDVEDLEFKSGRTLREYQLTGVQWLDQNYRRKTSCMLGDEMGLGKTFQTVAMLETLRYKHSKNGQFLVVAPVSTLGHWQREIETLTNMYCVVYKGDANDRDTIRTYEMGSRVKRFHVLLTSFELLIKDFWFLKNITWQYVVVDEAHRLKGRKSQISKAIRDLNMDPGHLLLLTGTPVQNNTNELFALLNLLDSKKFNSEDDFMERYGNIRDSERVRELQEILKPILLRRKKEDVEKTIPQKEEIIIWVELTKVQRSYYKACYEGEIGTLLKGVKKGNLPNMRNVAMELRKLCNHPFLSNSVADNMIDCRRFEARGQLDHLGNEEIRTQLLQQGSGKMVLLGKLLPKLKEGGHKVLIFSQFKIMLDLLEEYIEDKGYQYERIDGDITGSNRQAAMDRFQAEGSESFVFLLSTRAGGLGITLTAADTCIIYDSDWNPQNDLQAMARCHRIGQTKDVKVYRLVTKNTYEEQLFQAASRKYGLDEAILGDNMGEQRDPEQNKEIENLLLKGAYHCLQDEAAEQAAAKFGEEDIDQILMQRTETRQVGGTGKSSFAEATFAPVEEQLKWDELLPEAVAMEREREEANARALVEGLKHPRRRNKVNYMEKAAYADSDSDEDFDGSDEPRPSKKSASKELGWTEVELKRLEEKLISLGEGRWVDIQNEARLASRPLDDVTAVCSALIKLCKHVASAPKPAPPAADAPQKLPLLVTGPDSLPAAVSGALVAAAIEVPKLPFKTAVELDVPADARKAFDGAKFRERIVKNAEKYLKSLKDRRALEVAVGEDESLTRWLKSDAKYLTGTKLPQWWDWKCDKDLMLGAHRHGHRAFKRMTEDSSLCFPSLLAIRDPISPPLSNLATTSPGVSPAKSPSPSPAFAAREWPSDQSLSNRLKRLLERYPGAKAVEEARRASFERMQEAEQLRIEKLKREEKVRAEKVAQRLREEMARAQRLREEQARAQQEESSNAGEDSSDGEEQSSDEEFLDTLEEIAIVRAEMARQDEEKRVRAERKKAERRQREKAARKEKKRKLKEAAVMHAQDGGAGSVKETPRKDEAQKSPHSAVGFPKAQGGSQACLALGSPSKQQRAKPKDSKVENNSKRATPTKAPVASLRPFGGSTAQATKAASGPSFGKGELASKAAEEMSIEELPPPITNTVPKSGGRGPLAQVLTQQGAPKRTSSEGGSLEVGRSADFEKAKKKRPLEDGVHRSSGLGNEKSSKKARAQPVMDKENQPVPKKKKHSKYDLVGSKQQTIKSFMKLKQPVVVD